MPPSKGEDKTNSSTPDSSLWTTILPRRGRSRFLKAKDNDTAPDPPLAMPQGRKGNGKDIEDDATPDPPPPTTPPKRKGKDKDTKPLKSLQRLPIPHVDDVTKHLAGSTINSAEFTELVQASGCVESAIVLMGRCLNIDVESIKDLFTPGRLSFSGAKYRKIAPLFNMKHVYKEEDWKPLTIPRVSLPNSVKEDLLNAGVRAYKQSGAPSLHANEHVRVRFLGAWLSILISLFDGCVYDIPEQPMPGTTSSTGGKVEYELFMWQRTVVLLIEVKRQLAQGVELWDQLAQVMCELESACQMNRRISLRDFPIYAILADGKTWNFLAYDGTQRQFYKDESIQIVHPPFVEDNVLYMRDMISVCNRIFGMLLQGYINTLRAYEDKSIRRGLLGDDSKHSSSYDLPIPIPDSERPPVQRGSTKTWETKVSKILDCQGKFESAFSLFRNKDRVTANSVAEAAYRQLQDCVRNMDVEGGIDTTEVRNVIKRWKTKGDAKIDV